MQIKRKRDLSVFPKVYPLLLGFLNTVGYYRHLILVCFADNSAFASLAPNISCNNNYLYSLYKGVNAGDKIDILDWELLHVIIRHFLYYLEINEWHKHQKDIAIAKKIDICIARFELKANESIYRHNNAGQASIVAKRVAIVKHRMKDCKKICKKAFNIFAINI